MEKKIAQFQNKGMVRDTSISKASKELAFENFNIRVTARDHNTLLSVTNERGNIPIAITDESAPSKSLTITGNFVGYSVINEFLVLFTTTNTGAADSGFGVDYIYRLKSTEDPTKWTGIALVNGAKLNFSQENPIETLPYYETKDIIKVYWVDGYNQPRFINIMEEPENIKTQLLDFVSTIGNIPEVTITKNNSGSGLFPSGVIQYFFTYYNIYGQETNIIYSSPLYYLSDSDKGTPADSTCTCSFNIEVSNLDTSYKYIKVYSLIRTSLNGTPTVNVVGEYSISKDLTLDETKVKITDTGSYTETVDPTSLLYKGGRAISAGTLTQKDNTLFLGNLEIKDEIVDPDLDKAINDDRTGGRIDLKFQYTDNQEVLEEGDYSIPYYSAGELYPFVSQLSYDSSRIKTFKGGNTYRIGIRFTTSTGASTQIYWLGDIVNDKYPHYNTKNIKWDRAVVVYKPSSGVLDAISGKYQTATLFMAQASFQDRTVKAQGVLCPTMFQLKERCSNSPFAVSSWCFRPINGVKSFNHLQCVAPVASGLKLDEENDKVIASGEGIVPNQGAEMSHIMEEKNPYTNASSTPSPDDKSTLLYIVKSTTWHSGGNKIGRAWFTYGWEYNNGNISASTTDFKTGDYNSADKTYDDLINKVKENCGVDLTDSFTRNNFNSLRDESEDDKPSFYFDGDDGVKAYDYAPSWDSNTGFKDVAVKYHVSDIGSAEREKYRSLYGSYYFVDCSNQTFHSPEVEFGDITNSDNYKIRVIGYIELTGNLTAYHLDVTPDSTGNSIYASEDFSANTNNVFPNGLTAAPLVQGDIPEEGVESGRFTVLWTYPWHKTGSMSDTKKPEGQEGEYSELNSKYISNLYYSYFTHYPLTGNMKDTNKATSPWVSDAEIKIIEDTEGSLYTFSQDGVSRLYISNYDELISSPYENRYVDLDTGGYTFTAPFETLQTAASIHSSELTDPVQIAFRSSKHILVSFNGVLSGTSYITTIPPVFLPGGFARYTNNTTILNGTVLWDDTPLTNISTVNILRNSSSVVTLQYTEHLDSYYIFKDDWNYWKDINPEKTTYYVVLPEDSNSYALYKVTKAGEYKEVSAPTIDTEATKINLTNTSFTYKITFSENSEQGRIELRLSSDNSLVWSETITLSGVLEQTKTVTIDNLKDTDYKVVAVSIGPIGNEAETSEIIHPEGVLNPQLEVSPTSLKLDFKGSARTLSITANVPWEVSDTATYSEEANGVSVMKMQEPAPLAEEADTREIAVVLGDKITSGSYILVDTRFGSSWKFSSGSIEVNTPASNKYMNANITVPETKFNYPYLLLAELYVDNISPYGGDDQYAVESNTFIPISKSYNVDEMTTGKPIIGTEGDSFFQRYDFVKTYPAGEDKENNNTEMLSFMVETYNNLDGRTDNLRGMVDNTMIKPESIQTVNTVYNQNNNFTTGEVLGSSVVTKNTKFPSQITWSLTKTPGADIDAWTNITLASVHDFDGDKGPIRALRRYQNSVIGFQDKGIAEVLFNSRTQLATTQGIPIEIGNSGKVDGIRYITDKAGCVNKWSIVETSRGIYFIDNITSSISVYNGQITSLSDVKGFKSWIGNNNCTEIWNPKDFGNFIAFWDRVNDDVYFLKKEDDNDFTTLCYNEQLQQFTSFYNYGQVPMMANVEDKFISFRNGLWLQGEGDYNIIYGEPQSYHITYRITPEPYSDKTFTNLTYRADIFDMNQTNDFMPDEGLLTDSTFDTLEVWNEYQGNKVNLEFTAKDLYPDNRRKFRIWRMDIPRDKKSKDNPYGLNRIRNPWIYLKLEKDNTNLEDGHNERMEFHDLAVSYFE